MLGPSKITIQRSWFFSSKHAESPTEQFGIQNLWISFHTYLQAVTDLLNNENVSEIDRLRLVMLYALRYEKENPVQLMQLFNKLASRSPNYKPGVKSNLAPFSLNCISCLYLWIYSSAPPLKWIMICSSATTIHVSSSLVQGGSNLYF